MKWSRVRATLVPTGVATSTSTVPAPGGETAAMDVPLVTEKLWAATPPKVTAAAPVKPEPVTETLVPPVDGPVVGLTRVTVGTAP